MAPIKIITNQGENSNIGKNCTNGHSKGNDTVETLSSIDNEKKKTMMKWLAPGKQGLYDPYYEHEACGVGFIVNIDGKRSNKVKKKQKHHIPFGALFIYCKSFTLTLFTIDITRCTNTIGTYESSWCML